MEMRKETCYIEIYSVRCESADGYSLDARFFSTLELCGVQCTSFELQAEEDCWK
jgi:hypothetical protein